MLCFNFTKVFAVIGSHLLLVVNEIISLHVKTTGKMSYEKDNKTEKARLTAGPHTTKTACFAIPIGQLNYNILGSLRSYYGSGNENVTKQ